MQCSNAVDVLLLASKLKHGRYGQMIAGIFKRRDGVRGGCVVRHLLQFEGSSRVEHEVDPVAAFA